MRFSVIIPTFNRPAALDQCLTALGCLNYPRSDFEVLVVDDGSDPPPDEIIARHSAVLRLRSYRHARQGPARARNAALREAEGEYVAFTDDDCMPNEDWLCAFDRVFVEHPISGLGGAIVSAEDDGIFGRASQLLVTFLYHYAEADRSYLRFFCSNNLAFERLRLLEIGGFEEAFPLAAAEDRDICDRWLAHGELHFVADAIVRHRQNLSARSFWAQHYRYGRGAWQFWSRRRERGDPGRRLASWRFYWEMLTFPFSRAPFPDAIAIFLLFGVSQAACAAGYFAERRNCQRSSKNVFF